MDTTNEVASSVTSVKVCEHQTKVINNSFYCLIDYWLQYLSQDNPLDKSNLSRDARLNKKAGMLLVARLQIDSLYCYN